MDQVKIQRAPDGQWVGQWGGKVVTSATFDGVVAALKALMPFELKT